MTSLRDSNRIVIAGASSLLGAELKSLLEESRFAAADFRLVDEDTAVGTLTEAAGEAAVIQPVEEGSFNRARFIFFTGSAGFTRANIAAASASGGTIIDLSGALAAESGTVSWSPALEALTDKPFAKVSTYAIPSAPATAAAAISLALAPLNLQRLAFTAFQPVSETGRAGIEELESQTSQLLSFQNVGKPIFDTQVAFTLLDRYGAESPHKLASTRERVRAETHALLAGKWTIPAIQLLHAPVFYGSTFSANAGLASSTDRQAVLNACKRAAFVITDTQSGPSNVSAAGESLIQLAPPESDPAHPETWWFYGAADNIRLPAANAVKLADKLPS